MAELSLTCPKCNGVVNVPIEEDATEFVCTECGGTSPIQQGLDAFTSEVKDPLIGAVISECEVEAKVGEGGFGAVYRAFDRNLQRHVALKVMLQSLTSNLEFVQKFIREAITAAQLNHPNIVAIHKVGRDEDRNVHFLIMEFLEGKTLSEVMEERGVLPLDEVIAIILQCADALAVAHDKKIVHRDIKPENIMIDRHGVVKITDFGLAKTVTTDMKSTKVVGTPHYMSPEQFEGKAVDGRTDIYSLGISFYYMLTKAKPYEGTNTVQIIYSILTQDPKPVTEINAEVPEEIWRVIRKMIAKNLDDRYPDLREVRRDLLAFQERSVARKVTCPQCQVVNELGRKFCRECGKSLLLKCPECGHEDPAGTRHCGGCGANVEGIREIQEHLEQGEKLRGFGDLKRALALYEEVLKLDPEHEQATQATIAIKAELSRIVSQKEEIDDLVKQGDADQALKAVEELLNKFPKVEEVKTYGQTVRRSLRLRAVDAHLLVAEKAVEEGRHEDAIAAWDKALEVDPDREDLRAKRDDLEKRLAAFEQTLERAETALSRGRHADALNAAKDLLRLKPDHERAKEIHTEAKAKVESIESFVGDAREHLEKKEYAEAISRLETAHDISPGDEEVAALLDSARRGHARIEEKLSLVRRLLAEDRPAEALAGAEELLAENSGMSAAESLAEEARNDLARKKDEEEIAGLLAQAKEREAAGQYDRAAALCLEVLDRDPENEGAAMFRTRVEAKAAEVTRLKTLAEDHLKSCEFAQALAALNQLREILPGNKKLEARAEDTRQKLETVDAALRRAQDAVKRKRFDLAIKAADEALALAPANGPARNVKKEAERGRAGIQKHLEEARGLIASELFDDAMVELNKAEEKGAPKEEVEQLRAAADEGQVMLLKSDATRSFVFKDFEAAIERYEQVLAVERDDPDAKKGIRIAERMIRAREREGILSKALASVVLLAGLFVVQFLAVGVAKETSVGPDPSIVRETIPVAARPEPPTLGELVTLEQGATLDPETWSGVGARYAEYGREFEGVDEIDQGAEFAASMQAALQLSPDQPEARLAALREARAAAGTFPSLRDQRRTLVDRAMKDTIEHWVQAVSQSEGENWKAAVESYDRILEDATVRDTDLGKQVAESRRFASSMRAGEALVEGGQFLSAYTAFDNAVTSATEDDHREKATASRADAANAWIDALRERVRERAADPDSDPDALYRDVVGEIAVLIEKLGKLGMSREELYRKITGR